MSAAKTAATKVCTKCGVEKDLEEYGKRASAKDGRYSSCKVCERARVAARYALAKESPKSCAIDGCQRVAAPQRRHCTMHKSRISKHGVPGPAGELPRLQQETTYRGAHLRVERTRGRASSHPCVDCGQQAAEWSLSHDLPPDHFEDRNGSRLGYSVSPNRYAPMCQPCHRRFDRDALPDIDVHNLTKPTLTRTSERTLP